MLRTITLLLTLAFSQACFAGSTPYSTNSAGNLIQVTATKMLTRLEHDRNEIHNNPRHVYDLVDEILIPHIDFKRMSRWVLGKYWRRATPSERIEFVKEFRALIIRTYSTALAEYNGQTIKFLPARNNSDPNRATVRTEIQPDSGPTIPISYDLYRNTDREWKVYDVSIDGISLIANYRSSFGSQIRRSGGLRSVINQMKAKNQHAKK